MAFFRGDVFSYTLDKMTSLNVFLPHDDLPRLQVTDKPMRTLVLLHGLQGNASFWSRYSSIERYAQAHNIALIMPEGEMSMFVDMKHGLDYGEYYGKELKKIVGQLFNVPTDREHYSIAGFSMGGYGALRLSLQYPEEFSHCMCIAGAFMLGGERHLTELKNWQESDVRPSPYDPEYELQRTFKKSCEAAYGIAMEPSPETDLIQLAKSAVESGKDLPRILMTSGTEDFLHDVSIEYSKYFNSIGLEHELHTWEGDHCCKFVDETMRDYIGFFADEN